MFAELKEPAALGAVDTATTPAPFPNGTGKRLRDNERSILWEFVPVPATGASHRHQRDAAVIAFTGTTPTVTFVTHSTVHTNEAAAGVDRLYMIELK